jgi:hypothetical protein
LLFGYWMDRYVTVSDVLRKSNLVQLRFEILDRLELNALRARRSARDHPRNERGACRGVGEIEPIALSEQVEATWYSAIGPNSTT